MSKKSYAAEKTSKMTVMVFQLEGNDSTLQEGIKTISSAFAGLGVTKPQIRSLPPSPAGSDGLLENGVTDLEEQAEEPAVEQAQRPPRSKTPVRTPQVIEIDLNSPVPSLKKFFEGHDPEETNKRYLMCMYWLKHHGGIAEVTADHVHTCFRHMTWKTPRDAGAPMRVMKSSQQWLNKGKETGTYIINHVGENQVQDLIK